MNPTRGPRRAAPLLLAALLLAAPLLVPAAAGLRASDHHLRLLTDSTPDLTDIDSFVRSITSAFDDPQDRAIAIWRWGRRLRHQTSCAWSRGRLIWDPVLHYQSYGYMNCGIISALNIAVAMQAGFEGRYIQLGDHTVSELSWDDGQSWHLFDSSMSIFCYRHDGVVASCEDIRAAHACELSDGRSEPGHLYLYHGAPQCVSHLGPGGWRAASDHPVEYGRTLAAGAGSYTDGYSVSRYSRMAQWGRRYILNLRPGQSYTRYWHMVRTGPDYLRPARGEKDAGDPEMSSITRTVRASGYWRWRPDLPAAAAAVADGDDSRWQDLLHDHENLALRAESPHLAPRDPSKPARVDLKVDAANVITSIILSGEVVCPDAGSEVRVLVSRDAGLAWREVATLRGPGEKEDGVEPFGMRLRDEVAGHTEAILRFELRSGGDGGRPCGLRSLAVDTITQVNRLALPRLRRGRNRVQLRAGPAVESLVFWPVLHGGAFAETAHEEKDIFSQPATDSFYKATIGAGVNGEPCHVVWRVPAPTDIVRATVGARVCNRSPNDSVSIQLSWDGKEYEELARKSDGSEPFDLMVLETREPPEHDSARCVWVRCEFRTKSSASTYSTPGIQDIFVRVAHRPRVSGPFRPVEVHYEWTEHHADGAQRAGWHRHVATSPAEEWTIPVGGIRDPTMRRVQMRLRPEDRPLPRVLSAGSGTRDGEPPAEPTGRARTPEGPSVVLRWGTNLARGAPYTSSRAAVDANGDDGGRELTNGVIVAPTSRFASDWPETLQGATAGWDGEVELVVDLGEERDIAGVRVHTHQPDERVAHPARVDVDASGDGEEWTAVGTIRHDDLWSPPADYESWELEDDPRYAMLPAAGRLAFGFGLLVDTPPARARYVRFRVVPLPGRSVGISELEVYDRVATASWPEEEITMPRVEGGGR